MKKIQKKYIFNFEFLCSDEADFQNYFGNAEMELRRFWCHLKHS